jgi:hypothetical protein
VITRMIPGIERNVSSKSVSQRAFRLLASRASLVSSLMERVGSADARSDASFTALRRRNAPTPIVATAAARESARAMSELASSIEDSDMTPAANAPERKADELPLAETRYADSAVEAERRSKKYRGQDKDLDPFPDIPPALLSSEHLRSYVRETGMIHPFDDEFGRLKSASYEVNAGGQFIYWDTAGKKIVEPITKDGIFTLLPNSISFVQIESQFRLPQYIAVRFNLRIAHVHRGRATSATIRISPGRDRPPEVDQLWHAEAATKALPARRAGYREGQGQAPPRGSERLALRRWVPPLQLPEHALHRPVR